MNRFFLCMLSLCMAWCSMAPAYAVVPHSLRACGDVNEFPPYSYAVRVNGKKTAEVGGLDVDVLQKILHDSGRDIEIVLMPWARCVILGARGEFDILLDGIKSPLREREFLFATSLYSLTPILLYLKDKPKPELGTREDLLKLRVCSQADYNYESYGVPNSMISNRARTLDDASRMLKLDRCDVMLQQIEILRGNAQLGGVDLMNDPQFIYESPAWLKHIDFYFLVGKKVPYRTELIDILDRGIVAMKKSGEMDRLRNKQQFR